MRNTMFDIQILIFSRYYMLIHQLTHLYLHYIFITITRNFVIMWMSAKKYVTG